MFHFDEMEYFVPTVTPYAPTPTVIQKTLLTNADETSVYLLVLPPFMETPPETNANFTQTLYILSGEGIGQLGDVHFKLKPHSLLIIPKNVYFQLKSQSFLLKVLIVASSS